MAMASVAEADAVLQRIIEAYAALVPARTSPESRAQQLERTYSGQSRHAPSRASGRGRHSSWAYPLERA
jgi:hypothetical protein